MKKIVMIAAMLVTGFVAAAQTESEQQVATAVEQLRKAMVDADSVALTKLVSPDLSYGHSSAAVDTRASFIRTLVSGRNDFTSIDLSDQTIKISGDNAIVRHTFNGAMLDNGRTSTVKIHILMVWQKKGSNWVLLARQAVRLP
jgi:hypothetical protein